MPRLLEGAAVVRVLFIINYSVVEPLAAPYLSASLKAAGHEVDLVRVPKDEVLWKVLKYKPDVVGFSFTTGTHKRMFNLAERIRAVYPHALLVGGGPHCTYLPKESIESPLDAICLGESEATLVELLEHLSWTSWLGHPYVDGYVTGVWNKTPEGALIKGMTRPLPRVDELLEPDRSILYQYAEHRENPIKNVIASRGCPHSCSFCWNSNAVTTYGKELFRLRPARSVAEEIEQLRKLWPVKMIFFEDDLFGVSATWLQEFAKEHARLNNRFPYHAQVRPNYITEERVLLLKESGCVSITMAPEVGSEKLRRDLLHKVIPDERIHKAAHLLHAYRIPFRTENMLGLPTTSWADDLETLNMNIKLNPACAWASIYTPYVGTPLADVAIKSGEYEKRQLDDIPASFFEHTVLQFPQWRRRGVNNLQKLFGIVVDYPWLSGLVVKVLVFLPLGVLYKEWYKRWKVRSYRRNLFKVAYGP